MKYRFGLGWKSALKMGENTHSGHFLETCTGTLLACTGTHCVLVIFGQSVPVHFRGVPVHLLLCSQFRPVFVFWP